MVTVPNSFCDQTPSDLANLEQEAKITPGKCLGAEVIADDSGQWCGNGLEFITADAALTYADHLADRWTLVRKYRIVVKDHVEGRTAEDQK